MSQEKAWEGDHGFTGIALLAWERQRAAYRMVDAHIAWRTDKDPKIRGCYTLLLAWARSCPCPQTLGPGGTSEGADWVSQKRPCPEKPDLSGANLFRANLYGADLFRANLTGANLYGANLSGANLTGANLYGADLSGANLFRANLYGANLTGANLYGANLTRANLYGADLSGANLTGANLYGADLAGADLAGADFAGANLFRVNLEEWERGEDGYARRKTVKGA